MNTFAKRWLVYVVTFPFVLVYKLLGRSESWHELAYYQRTVPLSFLVKDCAYIFLEGSLLNIKFGYLGPMAVGVLGNNEYIGLDVVDREVLDIGASLGDTAILFALKGASKVVGYELNYENYLLAIRNVQVNRLGDKISIHYAGVSSQKIVREEKLLLAIMSSECAEAVESADHYSLSEVLEEFSAGYVLKCDVDGFEYEIFKDVPEKLSLARHVFIEYHFGVQDLVIKLVGLGFDVDVSNVGELYVEFHPEGYRQMDIGYISGSNLCADF